LKVAVDATVRFIAEQSVQTILHFSHKTPHQPDVDQLKLANFYREKTNNWPRTPSTTIYRCSLSTQAPLDRKRPRACPHALI